MTDIPTIAIYNSTICPDPCLLLGGNDSFPSDNDGTLTNHDRNWPFSVNLDRSYGNGTGFPPTNKTQWSQIHSRGAATNSTCCMSVMEKERATTREHNVTLMPESSTVKAYVQGVNTFKNGTNYGSVVELSSLNERYIEQNHPENFSTPDMNETDMMQENATSYEDSLTTSAAHDTSTKAERVRIWVDGILSRKMLITILTYFRCVIVIPVTISVISVGLSVAVFQNKKFGYHGKPMVICFNIFEGLKSIAYLMFRLSKLYIGDAEITWNSGYARFFVYYVMWIPVALGRIGILNNGLISLDRFFTIAFPIRRFNKRLVTYPKTCVFVIVVSMLLYQTAPLIIFFGQIEPNIDYQRTFHNDEIISEIYLAYPAAYERYMFVLTIGHAIFVYIPLLLALVFNTLTIVSLYRHQKVVQATLRQNNACPPTGGLSKTHTIKRQTNTMVVVSSLVFAMLVLFRRVLPLLSFFVPEFGEGRREMHLYILLNDILIFFDCVSPLVNIISYTILSSQFRSRLKTILWARPHGSTAQSRQSINTI